MINKHTGYEQYIKDFKAICNRPRQREPFWLNSIRANGIESFSRLGFPTSIKNNEKWKYTNVSPIARAKFQYPDNHIKINLPEVHDLVPWGYDWTSLVFVDGAFVKEFSSPSIGCNGITVNNIFEVDTSELEVVKSNLGNLVSVEENGFAAVNTAFLRDGAFIHLSDSCTPPSPINLVFITTKHENSVVTHPRVLVVLEDNSSLTLVESHVSESQESYFTNAVVEVKLGQNSEFDHYRYLMEGPGAFHVGNTYVNIDRDSSFRSTSFARGAKLARNGVDVTLDSPGSSCEVNGLYITSGDQHIDNNVNIEHAKPHTRSDQYFKGILDGSSRAVFSGSVVISKNAQKAQASQSDKNLILSDSARVNTKPSLEIYADDVQATHGATAGSVANDSIFYMMNRGLGQ